MKWLWLLYLYTYLPIPHVCGLILYMIIIQGNFYAFMWVNCAIFVWDWFSILLSSSLWWWRSELQIQHCTLYHEDKLVYAWKGSLWFSKLCLLFWCRPNSLWEMGMEVQMWNFQTIDTLNNSCTITLRSMPQDLTDDKLTLVQKMVWYHQVMLIYHQRCSVAFTKAVSQEIPMI